MPTLQEKAYEYATKPQPISAMWTIDGKEFPGTLEWVNDKPQLTVNEEIHTQTGTANANVHFLEISMKPIDKARLSELALPLAVYF